MNNVQLTGRLTKDVELKKLQNGTAVANFILAVDKELTKVKKQEYVNQGKQTADFIPVTVYGNSADNCAKYVGKGSKVVVQGRITTGNYTTQAGEKKYTMQVTAVRVEFTGDTRNNQQHQEPEMDIYDDECFLDNPEDDEETSF